MCCGSKFLRAVALTATFIAAAGTAAVGGAADKAKKSAPADDQQADPPQDLSALANSDDDAPVDGQAKNAAKKKTPAKTNKKVSAARQKKQEKAAQARQAKKDQTAADAANEAQQLQQLQQQQMQQAMMGQGRMRNGSYGGNGRNQSMFLLMRQFDINGNGQLDAQEMQAMKLEMAQIQAGGPNVAIAQYLRGFDTNGNGQLDANELQAAQAAMTRGMVGAQAGGGGLALPNGQVLPKAR